LESRHTSPYFLTRASRSKTARPWTKLSAAVDTASHFITGSTVSTGPSNDSPQFRPVLAQASLALRWDRVLADAAFDSEAHHAYAHEELGIRSSVIPINSRGRDVEPSGKYRQQMVRRFRPKPQGSRSKRVFGQRWQAETTFSQHKRRLGSSLSNRSDEARERECRLRVLTHDLMLLATAA
jgi:Transposase DDE domain